MKRLYILTLLFLIFVFPSKGQIADWGRILPGYGMLTTVVPFDFLDNAKLQTIGNDVVIAKTFADSVKFGNRTLTCTDSVSRNLVKSGSDIYLAKYSDTGAPVWIRHIYSKSKDKLTDMTVDSNSNIYISGFFHETLNIDAIQVKANSSSENHFIAKFNAAGSLLWVRLNGSFGNCRLATDNAGNLYVATYFIDSLKIYSTTYISNGSSD
ncbi:MAG: hypothetical protein LPJ89_03505, partial [Hymenobacteraceae bacterium]|nr:hypothetical protein [Hymenobacteraceae bacterium]